MLHFMLSGPHVTLEIPHRKRDMPRSTLSGPYGKRETSRGTIALPRGKRAMPRRTREAPYMKRAVPHGKLQMRCGTFAARGLRPPLAVICFPVSLVSTARQGIFKTAARCGCRLSRIVSNLPKYLAYLTVS
jgi:hypothetical protein